MTSAPTVGLRIRDAGPADVPLIHRFIRALAEYEREPESVAITEAELLRDGFAAAPLYHCLIAEWDGVPAGFALYFPIYSTWAGRGIHLEDLFVFSELRGKGIGKALIARVAAIAHAEGCRRMQWNVLDWNEPALGFYRQLGAELLAPWRIMRVTADSLAALAGESCLK